MSETLETARPAPAADPAPAVNPAPPVDPAPGRDWTVRAAAPRDASEIAAAVGELLVELGGTRPDTAAMQRMASETIADERAGLVLVAERADDGLVGVLAVSWVTAIHAGGAYGLIQDLWVHPDWRSRAVGTSLLAALGEAAQARGVTRIEVGLPRESFAGLQATAAFYRGNGFEPLGPRMRWAVGS